MAAKAKLNKDSNYISQDRNWKKRIEMERFSAKTWDLKWGFCVGTEHKNEETEKVEASGCGSQLNPMPGRTSAQEIGRHSSNLELFGRLQCKPRGCPLKTLNWPKEAIQ